MHKLRINRRIIFYKAIILFTGLFIVLDSTFALSGQKENPTLGKKGASIIVQVTDKNTSAPLQLVNIVLKKDNTIYSTAVTDITGQAKLSDIGFGTYQLLTHYLGYEQYSQKIAIDSAYNTIKITLKEKGIALNEVVVLDSKISHSSSNIDIKTGQQVFAGETYHGDPSGSIIKVIQQSLAGAAKAPSGEVHIRGQHGEFTYLIDGIPIPLGVFGGLNEIVDPKIISRMTFYTGGFPAEYGGQISAIMDIQNRVPTGHFHLDASSYLGSYLTSGTELGNSVGNLKKINSNGQAVDLSNHIDKLGYFFSFSRSESDRRIDQPVENLFHDHGFDYTAYGKIDYLINENDFLTANLNYSKTQSQIPFDSTEGIALDNQNSYNSFQTLSFYHNFNKEPDHESSLFLGLFLREGGLKYTQDLADDHRVYLEDDSTQSYVIDQNRSFLSTGIRSKFEQRINHSFLYAFGFNYSNTSGTENFRLFNSLGDKMTNVSKYSGYDFGIFAQSELHLIEWTKFEIGIRYDMHKAPQLGLLSQMSPRLKISIYPDEYNTISFSYSRLFMPSNIENLGAIASKLINSTSVTQPEKQDLYEISYNRNWGYGINSKLSYFRKESSPGTDDETLASSTIRLNVNVNKIKTNGIELALSYSDPESPLSLFSNMSIIHAYGIGPVSGGFLPADSSSNVFDLDHDQRLTAVLGFNYQPELWFVNFTCNYNSGLANGNESYIYKTGLFDFNQGGHTTPSWICNIAAGYKFPIGKNQSIEPSLYVSNIFDHSHLIKGTFFSGASFEERRNVVIKLEYHL
ncbi:MAG: carboxypeptidase-like regulatory domain-containing protein [Bacteroidota bacterium]|nr:carboxypeptidase-like regulatory domain-containing protein [Bacteroidota bacterium]